MAPSPRKPVLIVINGAPGAGKTTLLRKLRKDLALPGIGKDDIKELLFDHLGIGDQDWSRDLGAVTFEMVYTLIEKWVGMGHDLIIENAFYREFAAGRIAKVVSDAHATFVEIHCATDPEVRTKRFIQRMKDGTRHVGHADTVIMESEDVIQSRYAPLEIGELIRVDTTVFGEQEYRELLKNVEDFLKRNQEG